MKSMLAVLVLLLAVHCAYSLWNPQKRENAEKEDDVAAVAAGMERALREFANYPEIDNEADSAMERRGIGECRGFLQKCNWFKHCCGTMKCSRRNVQYSGRCQLRGPSD